MRLALKGSDRDLIGMEMIEVISFYSFTKIERFGELSVLRNDLAKLLRDERIFGTIILAEEGFNANLCGLPERIQVFLERFRQIIDVEIDHRSAFYSKAPFRKHEVKIKPEIVTFKQNVEIELAAGSHVEPSEWNALLSDPEVLVIDTRNDYEYRSGSFVNAVNPSTSKFSELPQFVDACLDPARHKKIAMFCTGGIRCEKFAPYLKERGFEDVFQLKGGILRYLAEIPAEDQLWRGECFVFDERVSVDHSLRKGNSPDLSLRHGSTNEK